MPQDHSPILSSPPRGIAPFRALPPAFWVAATVTLGLLTLYLVTLGKTIAGGDSGELATAVCATAIPHPPGFPAFLLAGKAFASLPISTVAWRLGLLSAVATALTSGILCLCLSLLAVPLLCAAWSGLAYGLAVDVWRYALVPEVFALNGLLLALLLLCKIKRAQGAGAGWLCASGVVFGLGCANHPTFLFFAFPLQVWSLARQRPRGVAAWAGLLGGIALGLSPYFFLYWAARQDSPYSWGDLQSVWGFFTHLTRGEYGSFRLANREGAADLWANWRFFSSQLREQWGLFLPLLAALGGVAMLRRQRPLPSLSLCLLAAFAVYLGLFYLGANVNLSQATHREVLRRFGLLPFLVVSVFAGFGLAALLGPIPRTPWAWLLAIATLSPAVFNFKNADRRGKDLIESQATATLNSLAPRALVLLHGDLSYALTYLQACGGQRQDLRLVIRDYLQTDWARDRVRRHFPDIKLPEHGAYGPAPLTSSGHYGLGELFDLNQHEHQIYASNLDTSSWEMRDAPLWTARHQLLPWGMLNAVFPAATNPDWRQYAADSIAALAPLPSVEVAVARGERGGWEDVVMHDIANAYYRRGAALVQASASSPDIFPLAEAALLKAATLPNQNMPLLYKASGYLYMLWSKSMGADELLLRAFCQRAWQAYLDHPPADDPDTAAVAAMLAQMPASAPH